VPTGHLVYARAGSLLAVPGESLMARPRRLTASRLRVSITSMTSPVSFSQVK
jgi:hypothetical protein